MNEFREGYGPLLAATIGTMCGLLTITNYSQGFFVGPVTADLGWTPPQFFLGFTVMMCVGLISGPLVGSLAGKYGIRLLGIAGLVGHALAYWMISLNNGSLFLWYASFSLLAVLGAGSLPIIWTSVLNGYFVKHRGKAIGIIMAGTGMGAFILPPIVEFFIENYGWRVAYRAIGTGALCVSLPIVLALFREKTALEAQTSHGSDVGARGMTRAQALRTLRFWMLGAVLFVTVFVIVGLLSNFERIMSAKGFERNTIAVIAAAMGLAVIVGRLLVGVLIDKFWAPGIAALFFLMPVFGVLLIQFGDVSFSAGLAVGIAVGLAAGAELDLLAYLTGKYFGSAHYPEIFGTIFAFFTVGAGLAPSFYGAGAQMWQGYGMVLDISIALLMLSILLFLALGRYPQSDLNPEPALSS
ncbi:MFS transporter [Pseudomaricurvus alkylphenolicus]|uniref:MFS transporter n=1 Tax=Pseudomaricurvus alkylphenolicus TaxID=1306991 RepID=UPI001422A540|nr:MFS transporter [Pseudomaricurvus alkylphenolicus]NIB38499.1 MFS transporter [Pseudomaricurvus alkylphenolicus]